MFFFETLDVLYHGAGHLHDALHELFPGFLALGNQVHLVFPFAGEFRAGEGVAVHGRKHLDQVKGLGGRDHVLAVADHVLVADQLFDNGCAGGGGAETTFLHGVPQFVVFHQLTRTFHHGKERTFGVVGRRLGKVFFRFDGNGLRLVAVQFGNVGLVVAILAVNRLETRVHQNLAFGKEGFALDGGNAGGV